jgi:hypothetical protein
MPYKKVGNMKKLFILLSILILLVISLSGCSSSTINNQRLEQDILDIKELALINSVKEMNIITKIESDTSFEYKLRTTLESYNYSAIADITLYYEKNSGAWDLSDHQVDIVSISAKNDPSVSVAVSKVIAKVSNGLLNHPSLIGVSQTYTLLSSTGSKESGVMSLVIGEVFNDDHMTIDVKYMVDAVYDFQTGWNFTLTDWVYTENMRWSGTYDLTWTRSEPQFPGLPTNLYFAVGDQILGLYISGESSYVRHMDQTEIFNNTLRVQYSFKGKDYDLIPIVDNSTTSFTVVFDNNPNESFITFNYSTYPRDYTDSNYIPFNCYAPHELYGILVDHQYLGEH